jgi:hypothetical protein
LCVVASAGQTYSGRFSLGVSAGTNIQAMPANSQYGIMNIESSDLTALNTGVSLAGNLKGKFSVWLGDPTQAVTFSSENISSGMAASTVPGRTVITVFKPED